MRKLFLPVLIILISFVAANSQSYKTDSAYVEFIGKVPLHSFQGTSNKLSGSINMETSEIAFQIDLNTLDTGNDKRDRKMYETLATDTYPFAKFQGVITPSFDPANPDTQTVTANGTFSVHGVTQKISVIGYLILTDGGIEANASWTLLLDDYDIEPPGFLFYKVQQEQEIVIKALLQPSESTAN